MNTIDHLPPHDPAAERAAIGCAIQEPSLAAELDASMFYLIENQQAAGTIMAMAAEGSPVAADTVAHRLIDSGLASGIDLVSACIGEAPSAGNWPYFRDLLHEKRTLRRIVAVGSEYASKAHDPEGADASQLLEAFEQAAMGIRGNGSSDGERDIRATLIELLNEYEQAKLGVAPPRIRTGFDKLDAMLGGLSPGQVFVIAARPSVGKTSLALNAALHVARSGRPVGFFSLEMTAKQLLHRAVSGLADIDSTQLAGGKLTDREMSRMGTAQLLLAKAPLHIVDRGGLTVGQLAGHARRMKQRHGVQLLIVDYLGLLRCGERGRSKYEETSIVSGSIKALAKGLEVPVILLAQLNRDSERDNREPRLSDLRDSGSIEQDADAVLMLHRPEAESGDTQLISCLLLKNRTGAVGKVNLLFKRCTTTFEEP